jgi:dihydrofolate reductase
MRKLIVTEFMTADGVMEAPGGEATHPHSGWAMHDHTDESLAYKLKETLEVDAHLLGRVTYESFADAWPKRSGEFAEKLNSDPKYVVTSTLDELEWENSTPLKGDVIEEVRKLKDSDGGPVLVAGSCQLVHALHNAGLVDEYRLMVFPVVLGSGKRVFPETEDKTPLELVELQNLGGVQLQVYRPAG